MTWRKWLKSQIIDRGYATEHNSAIKADGTFHIPRPSQWQVTFWLRQAFPDYWIHKAVVSDIHSWKIALLWYESGWEVRPGSLVSTCDSYFIFLPRKYFVFKAVCTISRVHDVSILCCKCSASVPPFDIYETCFGQKAAAQQCTIGAVILCQAYSEILTCWENIIRFYKNLWTLCKNN